MFHIHAFVCAWRIFAGYSLYYFLSFSFRVIGCGILDYDLGSMVSGYIASVLILSCDEKFVMTFQALHFL